MPSPQDASYRVEPTSGETPIERAVGGRAAVAALARTFIAALVRPGAAARRVPEPIRHGRILAAAAAVRLLPWCVTVTVVAARYLSTDVTVAPLLPIHRFVAAPVARALSVWSLLVVPVGVCLAYFVHGLVTHLGLVLTGGARWPLGATARALGIAWLPVYLGAGVVEFLAQGISAPVAVAGGALAAVAVWALLAGARAVSVCHRIGWGHGLVAVIPAVLLWTLVLAGRVVLVLGTLPGLELPPPSPYAVP